ncbi:hypothetical protein [Oceanobacillus sojae]|uniref:Uncharacterized protein n=1 Tax=Oceanobacillus sojae TaxID=582851 RepID=A0A511ZFQ8_9BACI|nr:hypothetical protein [Oceanobacillus sojae]GEN86283.1 hypothetical protein OSO01_10220 [Oceanobacillus sojae]
MEAKERREQIKQYCQEYDSIYAKLVEPINDMLMDVDAGISEETTNKILENLKLSSEGKKEVFDCHLDESNNFLRDGIEDLKNGNLGDGALQIFGAGLNFASYAAKASQTQETNAHEMLDERFKKLKTTLK